MYNGRHCLDPCSDHVSFQDKALEDLGEFDPTMKKKKKKKKEFVPDGDEMPLDNDIDGKRFLNFDNCSS